MIFLRLRQFLFLLFFKDFIYLFLEREEGREKERERNINVWLPLSCPSLGTQPTSQACALTGNQTSDPLVSRLALNPLSHTSWISNLLLWPPFPRFFLTICFFPLFFTMHLKTLVPMLINNFISSKFPSTCFCGYLTINTWFISLKSSFPTIPLFFPAYLQVHSVQTPNLGLHRFLFLEPCHNPTKAQWMSWQTSKQGCGPQNS